MSVGWDYPRYDYDNRNMSGGWNYPRYDYDDRNMSGGWNYPRYDNDKRLRLGLWRYSLERSLFYVRIGELTIGMMCNFAEENFLLFGHGLNINPHYITNLRMQLGQLFDDFPAHIIHGNKERFKREVIPNLRFKFSHYKNGPPLCLDSMADLRRLLESTRMYDGSGPHRFTFDAYHPDLPFLHLWNGRNASLDHFILPATTATSSSSATTTTTTTTKECVICQENLVNHVLIPCGHICLCEHCSTNENLNRMRSQGCPICRQRFDRSMKVYW